MKNNSPPTTSNMVAFQLTLRIMGGAIILVALTHIVLGPNADVLLGANISHSSLIDPTIDSQNRFYGAAFALYGVILIICSSEVAKYRSMLFWTMLVFFAAGLARLVSAMVVGWPPLIVALLLVIELLVPPIVIWWLRKSIRESEASSGT